MSSGFKKTNLVSMSKETTENDKNVSTKIVAAMFENEIGSEEVSGEKFWRNFEYFDARKSDYSMKRVSLPENTLFYNHIWQSRKKQKDFLLPLFIVGQILGSSNPHQDVSSYTLKENGLFCCKKFS